MVRHALAALSLFGVLAATWAWAEGETVTGGVAARVAVVLAALWLAWPSLVRLSPRSIAMASLSVLVLVWRPRAAWIVLPVLFLVLGRPRSRATARR